MERVVGIWVAYDGTDFCGWQRQQAIANCQLPIANYQSPNANRQSAIDNRQSTSGNRVRTVQGLLEEAIQRVVRHPIHLIGSGRTDSGVHAAGQVASFVTTCPLPADRLAHAVGSRLPHDLAVLAVRDVHPEFNARTSAVSKLYRYRIHNAPIRPVKNLTQRYTYHVWHPLDVDRMRAAAAYFVGEKDFAALAGRDSTSRTTVRTVFRCDIRSVTDCQLPITNCQLPIDKASEEVWVEVEGSGFLYHQVRNIVGTLLNVGLGRWDPDRIPGILNSRDRSQAGPTAPALGLCLQWVCYPSHLLETSKSRRAGIETSKQAIGNWQQA